MMLYSCPSIGKNRPSVGKIEKSSKPSIRPERRVVKNIWSSITPKLLLIGIVMAYIKITDANNHFVLPMDFNFIIFTDRPRLCGSLATEVKKDWGNPLAKFITQFNKYLNFIRDACYRYRMKKVDARSILMDILHSAEKRLTFCEHQKGHSR
jgi:hypothetical protein